MADEDRSQPQDRVFEWGLCLAALSCAPPLLSLYYNGYGRPWAAEIVVSIRMAFLVAATILIWWRTIKTERLPFWVWFGHLACLSLSGMAQSRAGDAYLHWNQ